MILRIASVEPAALVGFVGTDVSGQYWVYLPGLALTAIGMLAIAPTRGRLERLDQELAAGGSPRSLRRALLENPLRRS